MRMIFKLKDGSILHQDNIEMPAINQAMLSMFAQNMKIDRNGKNVLKARGKDLSDIRSVEIIFE